MSRGKHAAIAQRARADRFLDALVAAQRAADEWKARAEEAQHAAAAADVLRRRVSTLEAHVADATSDEVEGLRAELVAVRATHDATLDRLADIHRRLDVILPPDVEAELRVLFGPARYGRLVSGSRGARRLAMNATPGTTAELASAAWKGRA